VKIAAECDRANYYQDKVLYFLGGKFDGSFVLRTLHVVFGQVAQSAGGAPGKLLLDWVLAYVAIHESAHQYLGLQVRRSASFPFRNVVVVVVLMVVFVVVVVTTAEDR
jgi:hypothetical protein